MVGMAVNVTLVPEQMVPADAETATVGTTVDDTDMVILFEVAVAGLAQASDDVITTVTTSPFTNAAFW